MAAVMGQSLEEATVTTGSVLAMIEAAEAWVAANSTLAEKARDVEAEDRYNVPPKELFDEHLLPIGRAAKHVVGDLLLPQMFVKVFKSTWDAIDGGWDYVSRKAVLEGLTALKAALQPAQS